MPASPRSAKVEAVTFPAADPTLALDGRLLLKLDPLATANAVLVVLHPHALLGGSLRDPVAAALARAAAAHPAFTAVARFNLRGVGGSDGRRGLGLGPGPADALAVAAAVVDRVVRARGGGGAPPRVYLAGYSWGACVAAAAAAAPGSGVAGVACVSPPLGWAASAALGAGAAFAALGGAPSIPARVVIGDCDQFAGEGRVRAAVSGANRARARAAERAAAARGPPAHPPPLELVDLAIIPGADHFWAGDGGDGAWAGEWGEVALSAVAWLAAADARRFGGGRGG